MPSLVETVESRAKTQQIAWLQGLTLAWMTVECSAALSAAFASRSVALLAFGSDSAVEFLSATVVLMQVAGVARISERLASRWAGGLLFALAIAIATMSLVALVRQSQAEVSAGGIAITSATLLIMPLLGVLKRRKARELDNRALAADAVQSFTCAYLAAVTLCSLLVNALFQIAWLDGVAGMLAIPILVIEGCRAWQGHSCGCCS